MNNTVIIVLGPTGVGKTGFSIILATALKTEIISADSMLIYRHMDIGTAKPDIHELQSVLHHLINIIDPDQTFSAGLFREKASAIINNLHGQGKVPVIVGGTGLYIRSLTKGLFEGPGADWSLRERLGEEEKHHGEGYLFNKLLEIDPVTAKKLSSGDTRRIIRALEVCMKEKTAISEYQKKSTRPLNCSFIKIGLSRDRKELYRLIEERIDSMMESGLVQETKRLLKINPGRTAMQAIGYKEIADHLKGNLNLDEAVRLIKKRSKMYAKKQFTWFRKEPEVQWVDISGIKEPDIIFEKVLNDVTMLKELLN